MSNKVYWSFQQYMWSTFFNHPQTLGMTYLFLITGLFISYFLFLRKVNEDKVKKILSTKKYFKIFLLFSIPLLISYNALSSDVFNYMFNTKMIIQYQANPHILTALDFNSDPWVRFMHNVHTTAPYGYAWTALSLVPFLLGFGKFITTWLSFKLFSLLSVFLLIWSLNLLSVFLRQQKLQFYDFSLLFLNPLFLIEIISNTHNDLWMMVPAVLSIYYLLRAEKNRKISFYLLSILLLLFSIFIKYSSLVMIPIWLILFIPKVLLKSISKSSTKIHETIMYLKKPTVWLILISILFFIPLLTSRSQRFHPWYLTWSMTWLPLIKNKRFKELIVLLSASAMFRYTIYLYTFTHNDVTLGQQQLITFTPLILYPIYLLFRKTFAKKSLI